VLLEILVLQMMVEMAEIHFMEMLLEDTVVLIKKTVLLDKMIQEVEVEVRVTH